MNFKWDKRNQLENIGAFSKYCWWYKRTAVICSKYDCHFSTKRIAFFSHKVLRYNTIKINLTISLHGLRSGPVLKIWTSNSKFINKSLNGFHSELSWWQFTCSTAAHSCLEKMMSWSILTWLKTSYCQCASAEWGCGGNHHTELTCAVSVNLSFPDNRSMLITGAATVPLGCPGNKTHSVLMTNTQCCGWSEKKARPVFAYLAKLTTCFIRLTIK